MKLKIKTTVEARWLDVTIPIRDHGEDDDMPADAPLRKGNTWSCRIDLNEGQILGWPGGTLAFCEKVRDQGVYVLRDGATKQLAMIEDYVPNSLLPGEYGDYLELNIDGTGKITNWLKNPSLAAFEEREK